MKKKPVYILKQDENNKKTVDRMAHCDVCNIDISRADILVNQRVNMLSIIMERSSVKYVKKIFV